MRPGRITPGLVRFAHVPVIAAAIALPRAKAMPKWRRNYGISLAF